MVEREVRLESLKQDIYLSKRFFPRISENMHYEIFKYIDSRDLVEIRGARMGGYQLTSNRQIRSNIGNYLVKIRPDFNNYPQSDSKYLLELINEHSGGNNLGR